MLQKVKVVFHQNRFIEIGASDLALLNLEITENSEFKQEIILWNKKADRKEVYICFKTSKNLCSSLHTNCLVEYIASFLKSLLYWNGFTKSERFDLTPQNGQTHPSKRKRKDKEEETEKTTIKKLKKKKKYGKFFFLLI